MLTEPGIVSHSREPAFLRPVSREVPEGGTTEDTDPHCEKALERAGRFAVPVASPAT